MERGEDMFTSQFLNIYPKNHPNNHHLLNPLDISDILLSTQLTHYQNHNLDMDTVQDGFTISATTITYMEMAQEIFWIMAFLAAREDEAV